jgi:hypothetical protein
MRLVLAGTMHRPLDQNFSPSSQILSHPSHNQLISFHISTVKSFRSYFMMSFQTCANHSCSCKNFESKPEGHGLEHPYGWYLLYASIVVGAHGSWASNQLLALSMNCTIDLLIDALEDGNGKQQKCTLRDTIKSSTVNRYTTAAEVIHQMDKARPIPVFVYGL